MEYYKSTTSYEIKSSQRREWIEIDGSRSAVAVYFLTFDEERIHSNVTMISIMSLSVSTYKTGAWLLPSISGLIKNALERFYAWC